MSPKDLGAEPIAVEHPVEPAFDGAVAKDTDIDPKDLARLADRPFPSIDRGYPFKALGRR